MNKQSVFILLTLLTCSTVLGQTRVTTTDSLRIKIRCESFFDWYIDLIKKNEIKDFNPQFVRTADGMTDLDFTNYRNGLKDNFFTDELINDLVKNFKDCQGNLKTIPYERFKDFTDLDQFENIKCDFCNRYEFIGGMEPIDGANVTKIKKLNRKIVEVTMTLFYLTDNKKQVHGQTTMTLQRHKKNIFWKINNIRTGV
ncbi:MAG: hypothetical protein KIT51_04750 [Cyclobacteriaceae bacterium]|nr:MAG: hypothetical protein KIT51_04705 [Cyclobacteriaceae bacterium]UYN87572.1 MAG: hypothetical protein KIT51_04750 [Cyclobacteriaceae bacterium]